MLITKAIDALLELAVQKPVEYGWNQALRKDRVLYVLDKVGLKPDEIPPEFDAVYAHTLVEWGAVKKAEEINFFRHAEVQKAFSRAFDSDDDSNFEWETEGIVALLTSQGERFHGDPRTQLNEFAAIFRRLALATRTPSEVLRDQSIIRLHTEIGALQLELQGLRQERKDTEIIALLNRFTAEQPEDNDREALRPYLEWVQRRSQRLAISTLDPAQKDSDEVTLGDVFVNLDAGEMEVAWPDDPQQHGVITAALGHIHYHRQIAIKGDPGSGKSTLLHYLAYCLAGDCIDDEAGFLQRLQWEVEREPEERLDEQRFLQRDGEQEDREVRMQHWQGSYVPILIELRNFVRQPFEPSDALAYWRYFKRYLEEDVFDAEMVQELQVTRDALYRRDVRGEVIWLLDGIDEVPLQQRKEVWQAVGALESGILGGGRWVATSRILSFDEALLPRRGVAVQTLRPMSLRQIKQFVSDWFQALRQAGELTITEADTKAERLQYAVQHRGEDFSKMAANPMLLTIMALVQTYHGTLPEQRARLYKACVDTLLLRWQRRKETISEAALPTVLAELGVDYGELERLLWEVGWKAHEGARSREEAADIPREEVLTIAQKHLGSLTKAAAFIEYTEQRAHILIGRGGQEKDMYTFPHRTLQEFLAACHLATQRKMGGKMRALAVEGDMWREVLNLAVGTLVFNDNKVELALDAIAELLPETIPDRGDEAGWYQVWMAGELCAIIGQEATRKDEEGALFLPRLRSQLVALLDEGALKAAERHEAANALAQLGDERPGTGTAMVDDLRLPAIEWGNVVPAGEYTIGDKTLRPASIAASYQLAKYPVTVAQFACFADAEDVDDDVWWAGMPDDEKYRERITESRWSLSNRPRERVTWYQAVAFCRWLDHHLKAADLVAAYEEIDLPREEEWEVAARYAGEGLTDRRVYPWGDDITPDHANYNATGLRETSAVGLFPAGEQRELELYDLSGNVWEWCRNRYRKPGETAVDESGDPRTLRGGSWSSAHGSVRAAYRFFDIPHYRIVNFGFRLVRRLPSHPDP